MVKLSAILRINVHITPEFFDEIIILYYFDIYNIFDLVKSSIFFLCRVKICQNTAIFTRPSFEGHGLKARCDVKSRSR